MSNLSDGDRKILIGLLEEGKPIPEHFKSRLFPEGDKEYVELTKIYQLVYQGKKRKEDVIAETPAAPLQEIRSFNTDNAWPDGWQNMLVFGDNLMALKSIYEDQRGPNIYGTKNRIKLVYIDPPFATKQDFMKDREKAYRDKIVGARFVEFLRKRLILLREIIAEDGAICVHLDLKKGHYVKSILDEVFGEHNFRNEIIWQKIRAVKAQGLNFGNVHDNIFVYAKSEAYRVNTIYKDQDPNYVKKFDKVDPVTGERYQLVSMVQKGQGPPRKFGDQTLEPGPGRHWIWSQERIDEALNSSPPQIEFTSSGRPRKRQYLKVSEGKIVDDLWTDIYPVNSQALEATGYPTQKPESLLERIILASTTDEDIVLDAFSGSGTTVSVAEKLNRKWIGMDCGKLAIYTAQKRLLNLTSRIGSSTKDERSLQERILNLDGLTKNSAGLLLITEKAKKGDLLISNSFLETLHLLVSQSQLNGKFALVCPEDKFSISDFEEDDEGNRSIQKDDIEYTVKGQRN